MNGVAFQREVAVQTQKLLSSVITDEARDRVVERLVAWVTNEAVKKSGQDNTQLISDFCKRIEYLGATVELEYSSNGKLVVKASGDGAGVLLMLRSGTTWFNPAPDADEMIVNALLGETSI